MTRSSLPVSIPVAIAGAAIVAVAAACASPRPAHVQPRATGNPFAVDSVLSVCLRGDTTAVELLNRSSGAKRHERWIISPHGDVIDVESGETVMDSLEAVRFDYRSMIDQQRALVAKMTDLAAKAGEPVPPDPNCHEG